MISHMYSLIFVQQYSYDSCIISYNRIQQYVRVCCCWYCTDSVSSVDRLCRLLRLKDVPGVSWYATVAFVWRRRRFARGVEAGRTKRPNKKPYEYRSINTISGLLLIAVQYDNKKRKWRRRTKQKGLLSCRLSPVRPVWLALVGWPLSSAVGGLGYRDIHLPVMVERWCGQRGKGGGGSFCSASTSMNVSDTLVGRVVYMSTPRRV